MPKIINVVGARPNFMKIAPLCHAFADYPQLESLLVHTGQHYDEKLSTIFFEDLGIPRPDIDLGVGSGTREQQIERIKAAFEPMVLDLRPDAVLVVGDVNSTIACAEVARRHGVKIIHVEAGLRSYDLDMPEEHNRVETDRISDLLFVTEASGMDNLEREAIAGAKYLVGNVMIDTLVANFDKARGSAVLEQLSLTPGDYFVATFHRPSNVDERENLTRLVETIEEICRRGHLVLPLHPRTEKSLDRHELRRRLDRLRELTLCEPGTWTSCAWSAGRRRSSPIRAASRRKPLISAFPA